MDVINLKERFGRKYRVSYEDSYSAEYGQGARVCDPWLMSIRCKYGHIFPYGGTLLAASVDGHPKVAGQLRGLAGCRIHQDGDFGELNVVFDVELLPQVAKIMRPRRRRQLTAEQKAELAARLQHIRESGQQRPIESELTKQQGVFSAKDGS